MGRKTKAQEAADEYRAQEDFRRDLTRAETWAEVWRIATRGRDSWNSNLCYFMNYRVPGDGSREWERHLYGELTKRLGDVPKRVLDEG